MPDRYTRTEIETAFRRHYIRIEAVMAALSEERLNERDIYRVVHVSSDFCIIDDVKQEPKDGGLLSTYIKNSFSVCRELSLSKNADIPADASLVHMFAGLPLEMEKRQFLMVVYDAEAERYVLENSRERRQMLKSRIMITKTGIQFYLAMEEDIDRTVPIVGLN